MTFRRIRRCAVVLSVLLVAFPSSGLARDGVGGVDIDNNRVTAGSTANTIAFTYTADDASFRVADSDLAPLDSHTVGGKVVLDVPWMGVAGHEEVRALHLVTHETAS